MLRIMLRFERPKSVMISVVLRMLRLNEANPDPG
jgi:hypothetical protein